MEFTRQMEIDMITNPDKWLGETLCLKQKPKPGEKVDFDYVAFGVITNNRLPLVVYLQPNFISEKYYDSVEALLDDGWIVD